MDMKTILCGFMSARSPAITNFPIFFCYMDIIQGTLHSRVVLLIITSPKK